MAVILALAGYFADRFFTDTSSPSAWLFGGLTLFAFMAVERGRLLALVEDQASRRAATSARS